MKTMLRFSHASVIASVALVLAASFTTYGKDRIQSSQAPKSQTRGTKIDGTIELLKRMHTYLTESHRLSFSVDFEIDDRVLEIRSRGSGRLAIMKPNLFRVDIVNKGKAEVFVSDGKTLWIYKPSKRMFAEMPAGKTAIATMYSAAGLMNIPGRILDFFWTADYLESVGEDVRVTRIRSQKIAGRTCEGVRVVRMVDRFDVWLEGKAPHLPCKLISRRTDGSSQTIFTHHFTWKTESSFQDTKFQFSPPPNVKRGDPLDLE